MKISVIITAFNGAKYITKAVESFIEQDYKNKELVIVDGISTDGTHQIIEKYSRQFPDQIKWIKEKDRGISNARNIALNHVTGDVIGFLGCDDFLHKDFFKEFFYYAAQNPNFDVAYFNSYCVGFSNSFLNSADIRFTKRNLIKHCPVGSGESFYYRKKIFESHQFNEKNRYSMDYEFNMALISSEEKYLFFPINIAAVFNQDIGSNHSSANAVKQRLETVAVQLKYANRLVEKARIIWRAKKLIFKNFSLFKQIDI
jgi:glycosyltransferase involved in cell wall biosynthesis